MTGPARYIAFQDQMEQYLKFQSPELFDSLVATYARSKTPAAFIPHGGELHKGPFPVTFSFTDLHRMVETAHATLPIWSLLRLLHLASDREEQGDNLAFTGLRRRVELLRCEDWPW